MDTNTLLEQLKVDLGIVTDAYDNRLTQYLSAAKDQIEREGATLDNSSISDNMLMVMYAAWMWRKRDTGEGMPRMLRYQLNNRIFQKKVNADD